MIGQSETDDIRQKSRLISAKCTRKLVWNVGYLSSVLGSSAQNRIGFTGQFGSKERGLHPGSFLERSILVRRILGLDSS